MYQIFKKLMFGAFFSALFLIPFNQATAGHGGGGHGGGGGHHGGGGGGGKFMGGGGHHGMGHGGGSWHGGHGGWHGGGHGNWNRNWGGVGLYGLGGTYPAYSYSSNSYPTYYSDPYLYGYNNDGYYSSLDY